MPTLSNTEIMQLLIICVPIAIALITALVAIQANKKLNKKVNKSLELIKSLHSMVETQKQNLVTLEQRLDEHKVLVDAELSAQKELSQVEQSERYKSHESSLQVRIDKLEAHIEELALQDPSAKIYTKAQHLVKSGASIEEVMEACDLPRAEVEVMVGFQEKAKS